MGIRETLNQNEKIVTIVTIAIIALALMFVAAQLVCNRRSTTAQGPTQFFFSTDGKEYFADDANKIYPFDKDGKQAFRAYVYECPDTGEKYIGYLEGYTPDAKKMMEAARQPDASPGAQMDTIQLEITGKVVRRPDDSKWYTVSTQEGQKVISDARKKCEGAKLIQAK